ncbi:cytosine permease [Mycobacterium aquaticum]|uniref:cytosine permease n=1 Tax=Mycobacterium aquaticum TaxID=1927124 RepID=UPI0014734307|nr:cytosine permease [Mycobacterium aquaticum]
MTAITLPATPGELMAPTTAEPAATPGLLPTADQAGKVESHGIDYIPETERHGRARELFAVWAAPNVGYLALVVGGTLVLMGLSLWQALAVIVVGNLFSVLTGTWPPAAQPRAPPARSSPAQCSGSGVTG